MIAPPAFYSPSFISGCNGCCLHRKDQGPPLIPVTGINMLIVGLILAGFIWLVLQWVRRGEHQ